MDGDIASPLPPRRHERWFDLGFRLILIVLAGIWLLMPPPQRESQKHETGAATTTR